MIPACGFDGGYMGYKQYALSFSKYSCSPEILEHIFSGLGNLPVLWCGTEAD